MLYLPYIQANADFFDVVTKHIPYASSDKITTAISEIEIDLEHCAYMTCIVKVPSDIFIKSCLEYNQGLSLFYSRYKLTDEKYKTKSVKKSAEEILSSDYCD